MRREEEEEEGRGGEEEEEEGRRGGGGNTSPTSIIFSRVTWYQLSGTSGSKFFSSIKSRMNFFQ